MLGWKESGGQVGGAWRWRVSKLSPSPRLPGSSVAGDTELRVGFCHQQDGSFVELDCRKTKSSFSPG